MTRAARRAASIALLLAAAGLMSVLNLIVLAGEWIAPDSEDV